MLLIIYQPKWAVILQLCSTIVVTTIDEKWYIFICFYLLSGPALSV